MGRPPLIVFQVLISLRHIQHVILIHTHSNMHLKANKHGIIIPSLAFIYHGIKHYYQGQKHHKVDLDNTSKHSKIMRLNQTYSCSSTISYSFLKLNAYSCNYAWLALLHHNTYVLMHVHWYVHVHGIQTI